MITESQIYWITRLDGLKHLMEVVGILGSIFAGVALAFAFIIWMMEDKDQAKRACKILLPIWLVCAFVGMASIFVPSAKEYCAIKVIPVVAANDEVQELPNKVIELANEWIEELKPEEKD